jgi:hypothetical protein
MEFSTLVVQEEIHSGDGRQRYSTRFDLRRTALAPILRLVIVFSWTHSSKGVHTLNNPYMWPSMHLSSSRRFQHRKQTLIDARRDGSFVDI